MNRRAVRRYAGMMAMVLLLGGCGSSGGAGRTETPEMTSPEETVVQTEVSSEASAVETTEAAASTEETSETSVTEKETTGAAAETTTEESPETAEAAEEMTEAATEAEIAAGTETATEAAAETEATTAAETAPAAAGAASLNDIYSQIEQQVSLNSPMTVPEDFIANYFGIDVSAAEDYLFVMSEMATSAETIVIVKAGGADKQALADSLQTVINQKAAEMENYLPDQYDIVSRSTVHQTGDYVWMVISENAGAIESIIEAGLQ